METIIAVDSQPIDKTNVIDKLKSKMHTAFGAIAKLRDDQKNANNINGFILII